IPDPALKNVSEYDHRMVLRIERKPEPAAFAGVVDRHPRFRIGRAAVLRGSKEQPCSVVLLAGLLGGNAVTLVEPCGEDFATIVEPDRLKALAFIARRDRPRSGKAFAAIVRARVQNLPVEGLVPEDR